MAKAKKTPVKVVKPKAKKTPVKVAKPKAKKTPVKVLEIRPWVCPARVSGPGMVFGVNLFVSQKECEKAENLLEPFRKDIDGCFSNVGEWPVLNLEEAKTMFDKFQFINLRLEETKYKQVIEEMKKIHGHKEWQKFLKTDKKEAASMLNKIKRSQIVSISHALDLGDDLLFVFSTKEDKLAFELYLQEKLDWSDDRMDDFDMCESGVGGVYLIEDIKKLLKKSDDDDDDDEIARFFE